ncbi:hypothetical protein CC1G_08154 [Coprinopsis cinerea okayama7|uniref:Uncharacterized protein n=1 Tax=Coprinopsis cinerea (strain Okayama-7 / 130 / ATCC MYA-4618 / FGSC 9003) TaxID=240176 RepID=A8NZ45_COPC7|nr:hypothetical protein CC1G_08154 [Coprinopsis cinerea okayama7\|eukprot:XP_001837600.2 hypothetical protein CC1G_08154 [Coprinopsis cinerea okayama7\
MLLLLLLQTVLGEKALAGPLHGRQVEDFEDSSPLPTIKDEKHRIPTWATRTSSVNLSQTLWGCLFTLVCVAWITVRPNVPSPHDSHWKKLWRRIRLALWALVMPEMVLLWAGRQWFGEEALSIQGAHFIQMGGFALVHRRRNGQSWFFTVTAPLLNQIYLFDALPEVMDDHHPLRHFDIPRIAAAIRAHLSSTRSYHSPFTAEPLVFGVAALQVLWLVVTLWATIITRGLSELLLVEIITFAYLIMFASMWFFWWDKPVGVNDPVKIFAPRQTEDRRGIVPKEAKEYEEERHPSPSSSSKGKEPIRGDLDSTNAVISTRENDHDQEGGSSSTPAMPESPAYPSSRRPVEEQFPPYLLDEDNTALHKPHRSTREDDRVSIESCDLSYGWFWSKSINSPLLRRFNAPRLFRSIRRMAGNDHWESYMISTRMDYWAFSRERWGPALVLGRDRVRIPKEGVDNRERSKVPTYYAYTEEQAWNWGDQMKAMWVVGGLCFVFGAVHLVGWNFNLVPERLSEVVSLEGVPESTTNLINSLAHHGPIWRVIWRVSSFLVMFLPLTAAFVSSGELFNEAYCFLEMSVYPVTLLYVPAKIALFVLAVLQLDARFRYVMEVVPLVNGQCGELGAIFEGVNVLDAWWARFLPHFS